MFLSFELNSSDNIQILDPDSRHGRKLRYRGKNATVADLTKSALAKLPNEVLSMVYEKLDLRSTKLALSRLPNEVLALVYEYLDVPSRICLGLSNKFFARLSQIVSTDLTDGPSVVRFHENCQELSCLYANHISDRRILLLQLKKWMPRGLRLCWICLKYSKIGKCGSLDWHSTTSVRFDGYCRLNLDATKGLRKIHCHHRCADSASALSAYAMQTPGAAGGFIRFESVKAPPDDVHVYNAGF